MSSKIIVTVEVAGFHRWPDAPTEVEFLRSNHRHMFKIRVEAPVQHNDRDLEFFLMRREVMKWLNTLFPRLIHGFDFGCNSCESIAALMIERLTSCSAVEVWEDGENGARVEA